LAPPPSGFFYDGTTFEYSPVKNKKVFRICAVDENVIQDLTNENFRNEIESSSQPVVVEFTTRWCGSSHIHAPILKELAVQYRDRIKFFRIDIDHYPDIAAYYGIQRIPTFLLFKDGQAVDFIYGVVSREVLLEKLNILIDKSV